MPDIDATDSFELVRRGEKNVLYVNTDLDGNNGAEARLEALARIILAEGQEKDIVVDLDKKFVGETGIRSLLVIWRETQKAGGQTYISPNPQAMHKLAINGLLELFIMRPAA